MSFQFLPTKITFLAKPLKKTFVIPIIFYLTISFPFSEIKFIPDFWLAEFFEMG